jgi:hypothetical protein
MHAEIGTILFDSFRVLRKSLNRSILLRKLSPRSIDRVGNILECLLSLIAKRYLLSCWVFIIICPITQSHVNPHLCSKATLRLGKG